VISLNWDTALECAYQRLYGVAIPAGVLFKPHGDASRPGERWTLPDEAGLVPESVLSAVKQLDDQYVRTLLIIGYSERDAVVVEKLITPLDESWRTIRVGPSALGTDDLPLPAEVALPALSQQFMDQQSASAWYSVTYQGGRGIEAALRGERLSPRDVGVCPPLHEVSLLVEALLTDRAVVLNGPAGCGKSISAYQALRRLTDEGFETLRLRDDARAWGVSRWLADLRLFPWPKALLIDDAQDLSPDIVRELTEHADESTLILVVGIDHVAGGVRTFTVSAHAAVAQLARWVRDERDVLFPQIRAFDNHVGSHPRDLFFDNRVVAAERQATPWRFFYTLTGGWRRTRRAALELRDLDRADLALLLIAVAQIGGVDTGVDRRRLKGLLTELGRDEAWFDASLAELTERRLVLETDGRLRCAHLQSAFAVLSWMLHPPAQQLQPATQEIIVPPIASAAREDAAAAPTRVAEVLVAQDAQLRDADERADREIACRIVSNILDSTETPLRGLTWLSDGGSYIGARDVLRWQNVLSPSRYRALAARALRTPPSGDVAAAAQLLVQTVGHSRDDAVVNLIRSHDAQIKDWFSAISPENAWALGDLVNSLYQPDKDLAAQLANHADPARLANIVTEGGWPHSGSTGSALDRICNIGEPKVRESVQSLIDPDAFSRMIDDPTPEFWQVVELIDDLISVDHLLALRLFTRVAARLANQFSDDPVRRWNDMTQLSFRLGYGPFRPPRRHLPNEIVSAVRAFTHNLDRERVAAALSGPFELWGQLNFDLCVRFLANADQATFRQIVDRVDMTRFEESLRVSPDDPDRTALHIASELQDVRPDEVHAILDRIEPTLLRLDLSIAYMAPDVAARALRRGLPLDLKLTHQQWAIAADVLNRLHNFEPSLASEVARANAAAMAVGLAASHWSDPWQGLREWIPVCDLAAPGLLEEVIASLPTGVVSSWHRGLRRPRKYGRSRRKDIAPLVHRAAELSGHVAAEAAELLRRFPSLAR
jgi:hypothetical protein